jgi:hemerythrin-like metal-binding protein
LLQYNPGEPLSPAQIDYTNSIIYSGKHLLEIINGMLDLAAIEADRVRLSMEDIDARTLFEECISLMHPAAEVRKVTLTNLASNGDNPKLHTDVVRLKQVLLNLLSNAIKYNVEGGAVMLDAKMMVNDYFRISVIDTGKGIAPEFYKNIFEPFDRLGVECTHSIEGTGIGLTVTKKLVEKMNGHIGFESQEGAGSTFWVEIPLAERQTQLFWSEDLSVGIDVIDADHKILIGLLNKVSDPGLSHGEVGGVLTELLNYTVNHFKREEAVMVASNYPNIAEHTNIHHVLAAKATLLAEEWSENENPEVIAALLDFLRAWLVKHIMVEDRAIGRHIHDHDINIHSTLKQYNNSN